MVTAPEAAALLALASGHDNRKPNPGTTRAWASTLADVDFQDACKVINMHYGSSREWIMASDIAAGVRALEAQRIAAAPELDELEPPAWLESMPDGPEFNRAYVEWRQEQARRIRRGEPLEVGPTPVLSERQWPKQLVS